MLIKRRKNHRQGHPNSCNLNAGMLCLRYNRDKIILLPMLCGVINLKIQLQVGKFQ